MLVECGLQFGFRPWVELLDEDDANGHVLAFGSLDAEVVADLSGADEQAAGSLTSLSGRTFWNGFAEFGHGGGGVWVAEHPFRSEDD